MMSLVPNGQAEPAAVERLLAGVAGEGHLSPRLTVYRVGPEARCQVAGQSRRIGGAFQPSALMDETGTIHVFFQGRLDSSNDRTEKVIAHVTSADGGKSFSPVRLVNSVPMQTYAVSAFLHRPGGGPRRRISVLTSLSIDETLARLKDPAVVRRRLGIDVGRFTRKAACLVLEFYSDDGGRTWQRKEHFGISDRVYRRNGRDYYLAFINLIGQVRRIPAGPWKGRLILGGPLRGDYLPCPDREHFRQYRPSTSVIYSDDDGRTWQFGGVIADETAFRHNEGSAVAVESGRRLLLARRSNSRSAKGKTMHYSNDGGATWGEGFVTTVAATRCLQVLETCGDLVLCSAPGRVNRTEGRIYVSRDAGRTWTFRVIEPGAFSYSTVNRLTGPYLICCYSRGHHGEQGIAARIFSTAWLYRAR